MFDRKEDQPKDAVKKSIEIGPKMALAEFERWAETARIDIEIDTSDEDAAGKRAGIAAVTKAIEKGRFIVEEDGIGWFMADVQKKQVKIEFKNFYNGAHAAMDRKKEGHNNAKLNASLSAVTGHPDVTFVSMHPADLKLCQAVALLFLV